MLAITFKRPLARWPPAGGSRSALPVPVNDPLDQVNLADENPHIVQRLSQSIDDWLAYALAVKLDPAQMSTESLNPEERRRLCSLGYIAC